MGIACHHPQNEIWMKIYYIFVRVGSKPLLYSIIEYSKYSDGAIKALYESVFRKVVLQQIIRALISGGCTPGYQDFYKLCAYNINFTINLIVQQRSMILYTL